MAYLAFATIRSGLEGTEDTVRIMWDLTVEGSRNEKINSLASNLVRSIPAKAYAREASVLHRYVRENVRFTRDPFGTERVQTPDFTLFQRRQGDCDDMSVAFGALAMAIGFQVAFITVGTDPRRPGQFSHVFPAVLIGNRWVAADPSVRNARLGWEPPAMMRRVWTGVVN